MTGAAAWLLATAGGAGVTGPDAAAAALGAVPGIVGEVPLVPGASLLGGSLVGYLVYRVVSGSGDGAGGDSAPLTGVRSSSTTNNWQSAGRAGATGSGSRAGRLLLLGALVALHVAVLVGLVLAVDSGRSRFFGMTVIGLASVLLLDFLLFAPYDRVATAVFERTRPVWVVYQDPRFATGTLALAASVLLVVGRGVVFFLVVALLFGSLVLRAVLADDESVATPGTLALLGGGAGLLLAAQALTVPYYVRTLDTVYHATLAERITSAGSLAAVAGTRYADLPLFHTLSSVLAQMTGMDARTLMGVLFVVLFPVVVVAGFALVRNLTGSRRLGVLAGALAAFSPEFVAWGTQAHVQSLSFVFLAVFGLLFTKWRTDHRFTAAAAVVTLAWILTHHLSVFMAVVLLGVWAVWLLWAAVGRSDIGPVRRPLYQYVVLTISVAVYWVVSGVFWVPINWVTEFSPAASSGAPTTQFLIEFYSGPFELFGAATPFLFTQLHYVPFLALAGYGLWTVLRSGGEVPSRVYPMVLLGFFAAILVFVPNPAWIVARGIGALNRWGIMALLFVVPVAALGLERLTADSSRGGAVPIVALLVVTMAVLSVGAGFTDPSIADEAGYDKGARKHLSTGDIDAAEHVLQYSDDGPVGSSHVMSGYMAHAVWADLAPERPSRLTTLSVREGQLLTEPGLTLIEEQSLRTDGVKMTLQPPESEVYDGSVSVLAPVSLDAEALALDRRSVVYDNSDTVVTFQTDDADGD